MKRVVFLDMDGVVNSLPFFRRMQQGAPTQYLRHEIDPFAIRLLRQLLRETGARVVISSAWRNIASVILPRHGLPSSLILGVTPKCRGPRGMEIQAWINAHGPTNFVILDDDSDMAHLRSRLVQTDFNTGLTRSHVERAVEMLEAG